MTKIEIRLFNFIQKHILLIGIIVLTLISIRIRWSLFDFKSGDYECFLQPWYDEFKVKGGFTALAYDIGNYNVPYMVLMAIFTYIPLPPLVLIKLTSILFDYVCAITCSMIIFQLFINSKHQNMASILMYVTCIFLPNLILNSAYWGQCDSIYVSFLLLCILMLVKENYRFAILFFSVAFAFKLQAIFILPVLIILYLCNRKFSIYTFIIVPCVYFLMVFPAIITGRPIDHILKIYFGQIDETKYMSYNYPNLYSFILGEYKDLKTFAIWLTFGIIGIILIYLLYNNYKIMNINIISISLLITFVCVYFLPAMHDRYALILDLLSVVYAIFHRKRFYIPIIINFISLVGYMEFLGGEDIFDWRITALANGVIFIVVLFYTFKDIKYANASTNIDSLFA